LRNDGEFGRGWLY